MHALERWQATVASNLSLGSVPGFKKDDTQFRAEAAGSLGAGESSSLGSRAKDVMPTIRQQINTSQGSLKQTGKDFDVAVQGPGFFQVKTSAGLTGYTRNGEFHLDPTGTLVTNTGHQVMGEGGPITIDPELGPVTIDEAGEVTQGDTSIGKLALYDAPAAGDLRRVQDGLLIPKDGSTPARVTDPKVLQKFVEESNVAPLEEMVNLIQVSRAYEASQKVVTSLDQTTKNAIETLGNP